MKTVIAVKAIGRTPPGGTVKLPAAQARALVAMGHAAYAPVKSKAPRQYKRRDMVAETAAAPARSISASSLVLGASGAAVGASFAGTKPSFTTSAPVIGGILSGKSDDGKA